MERFAKTVYKGQTQNGFISQLLVAVFAVVPAGRALLMQQFFVLFHSHPLNYKVFRERGILQGLLALLTIPSPGRLLIDNKWRETVGLSLNAPAHTLALQPMSLRIASCIFELLNQAAELKYNTGGAWTLTAEVEVLSVLLAPVASHQALSDLSQEELTQFISKDSLLTLQQAQATSHEDTPRARQMTRLRRLGLWFLHRQFCQDLSESEPEPGAVEGKAREKKGSVEEGQKLSRENTKQVWKVKLV